MSELRSYYYYEDRVVTPATHQYRVYHADEVDKVIAKKDKELAKLKAEKEALLVKFRKFIDDHCAAIVTATRAVENLSPNIQMDFYETFIKEE